MKDIKLKCNKLNLRVLPAKHTIGPFLALTKGINFVPKHGSNIVYQIQDVRARDSKSDIHPSFFTRTMFLLLFSGLLHSEKRSSNWKLLYWQWEINFGGEKMIRKALQPRKFKIFLHTCRISCLIKILLAHVYPRFISIFSVSSMCWKCALYLWGSWTDPH